MYVDDGLGDFGRNAGNRRHTPQPTAVVVDRQNEPAARPGLPLRPRHQQPQPRLTAHAEPGDESRRRRQVALVDEEMQRRRRVAAVGHAAHVPGLTVDEAQPARRRP